MQRDTAMAYMVAMKDDSETAPHSCTYVGYKELDFCVNAAGRLCLKIFDVEFMKVEVRELVGDVVHGAFVGAWV